MSIIDKERIVGKGEDELDELTCGICQGIFNEPVVTQCCRQTYCKICINQWLINNNTCPNDRRLLSANMLLQPPRFVINLLNKLQVKCENYEKGCDIMLSLEMMKEHLKHCKPCNICNELKKVIKIKDEKIEMLQVQLKSKDDQLLQNLLQEDSEIEVLKAQLRSKEEELHHKLMIKHNELEESRKVIKINEEEIEVLNSRLRIKDDQIRQLHLLQPSCSSAPRNIVRDISSTRPGFVWKIIKGKYDIIWDEMVYGTSRTVSLSGKRMNTFFGRIYFKDKLKIMAEVINHPNSFPRVTFNTKLNDRWINMELNTDLIQIKGTSYKVDHFEILTNPYKVVQKWIKSPGQLVPPNAVVCSEEFGDIYYCGRVRVDMQPLPAKIKDGVAYYCDIPGEEPSEFQYLVYDI